MEECRPNAQTKILERDISNIGDRFDRHLEIYSQNGKELAALKTTVELARDDMKTIHKGIESLHAKVDEGHGQVSKRYVNKEELKPIKLIVYGAVGTVLSAVLVSGLGLIIINASVI